MALRPIKSGVFAQLFTKIGAAANVAAPVMLEAIAKRCEEKAKDNLSRFSHPHGRPTNASPGGPPAKVSGTLHDAVIAETAHLEAAGWTVRVGVLPGRTPWYSQTEAAYYGELLETGETRDGQDWPWLQPAFDEVVTGGALRASKAFRAGMGRL
jgi:hypothetical protein